MGMEKANNIDEVYDNFLPEIYLSPEDKEFYVPLYKKDLIRFKTDLIKEQTHKKSFFIAGQSGNGKSTILKMLDTNFVELQEKYEFRYLGGKDIFSYNDVSIIDLLLMIGSNLIQNNKKLQEKYFSSLDKIQDISNGTLNIEVVKQNTKDASASIGSSLNMSLNFLNIFKSKSSLEAQYKLNDTIREVSRRVFKTKENELIELINEIILDYKTSINTHKDLLIIIDDLEKKEDIDKLFLNELHHLDNINMVKIITMPIHLRRTQTFNNDSKDVREFALKLNDFKGDENQNDKNLLEQVILKRINNKHKLIDENTIKEAIKFSGGNLRQLIQLIKRGANEALSFDSTIIEKKELDYAIESMQRGLSSVTMAHQTLLKEILDNKILKDDSLEKLESLGKVTKMGLVFAYFNGKIWYEINPLIKNILKEYTSIK
jgi:energy-coupling factor transporter ATP-binding protein EcfA2